MGTLIHKMQSLFSAAAKCDGKYIPDSNYNTVGELAG